MKTKYYYSVNDDDPNSLYEFESVWDEEDAEDLAADAGENYHIYHNGWECSWPIDIYLYNEVKTLIGVYEVECEAVPQFTGRKK